MTAVVAQDRSPRAVLRQADLDMLAQGDLALNDAPVEAYARLHGVSMDEAESDLLRLAEDLAVGRYSEHVEATWRTPTVVSLCLDGLWTVGYCPDAAAIVYYSARDSRRWEDVKALRSLLSERKRVLQANPETLDDLPRPPGWLSADEVVERVRAGAPVRVAKGCRKKYQKGVDPTAPPEIIVEVFRDLITRGDVDDVFTAPIVGTHRFRTSLGTWTVDPGGTTLVGFHAAAEQGR